MKKGILCIFLAIVLLAAATGVISCQKAPPLTLEEKKAALVEILSDGKYDKDYVLVDLTGANPLDLANYQRAVLVEGFFKDENGDEQQISSAIALGWIYDYNYVVVPFQLLYLSDPDYGPTPMWKIPEITLKAYLLSDLRVDDEWQREKLGEISVKEDLGLAVIKRVDPIISVSYEYNVGKYQDLSVGDALYMTSQNNGRITVEPSAVSEILTHIKSINLFSTPGELMFNGLGSLAFAVRDGRFEMVGFLSVMEMMQGEQNMVYVYYLDIRQIIDFIGTKK